MTSPVLDAVEVANGAVSPDVDHGRATKMTAVMFVDVISAGPITETLDIPPRFFLLILVLGVFDMGIYPVDCIGSPETNL